MYGREVVLGSVAHTDTHTARSVCVCVSPFRSVAVGTPDPGRPANLRDEV